VITGAASGIGRALAGRCAREGMRVVLADVEAPALAETEAELREGAADVLAVLTDVSKAEDVEALARKTLDAYGAVHMLCNNAGVGAGSTAWESTINDWQWVIGVNLWGVLHGIRVFLPIMLDQGTEGHVVNTASVAGLISYAPDAPYHLTKHAVVALSEKLYYDLALRGAKVKISVLCPGMVHTRIMDGERNRPPELQDDRSAVEVTPGMGAAVEAQCRAIEAGMPPDQVADCTFEAIREDRFYILTHPELNPLIEARMRAILHGQGPVDLQTVSGEKQEIVTRKSRQRLTLARPATYQISVPGQTGESWADWAGGMTIAVDSEGDGPPVTTLTGTLDQAALHGLLRRLYSLGLPLVSVVCIE
jgi:NAD(P)-dependent dehydrogenase (short-subunit alcohol dehydrogenase family)